MSASQKGATFCGAALVFRCMDGYDKLNSII